jgi:hypothetical protein
MYIKATEPIPMAYFKNPSHQFACLYVYPFLPLLGNAFPRQKLHATKE